MKPALLASTLLLLPLALPAQREVPPTDFVQPGPKDIVIAGNELSQDVTCADSNAVYVQGQHNEVQVHGACRFIRVQGNRNYVWVDRMTTVPVEGNDNTVFVSDVRTQYSNRGNGNRFERSKH
jgi:hypothetical protein